MSGELILGRYEVDHPLGEGAMGQVYLAHDRAGQRDVVVKVMHDHVAAQPKFRELFEREMRLMSRLKHPNIVELYEASADPNCPCIIMEYVPGVDLESLVQKTPRFPLTRVGRILGQLCSALYCAHGQGIVHRDLKPANLMVVDAGNLREHIKVMDFGLAKLNDGVSISFEKLQGSSDSTIVTGTAEYMAPEQMRGDQIDHRSDLYSVGCLAYELLTGRLPFVRETVDALLEAHVDDPVPSFAAAGARGVAPATVEAVVMRCLSKYPNERPSDAWDLAECFQAAAGFTILQGPKPEIVPGPGAGGVGLTDDADGDDDAVVHRVEARWASDRTAAIKIKGFVDDAGGEVVESVPGRIRMQFGQVGCMYQLPKPKGGAFSWFRTVKPELIEVELQLAKRGGPSSNLVDVKVRLYPADGSSVPYDQVWHDCCDQIFHDLRAYIIS